MKTRQKLRYIRKIREENSPDLIPSPSPSVQIQIMGEKVEKAKHCWMLSMPSNVLPLRL